VKDIVSRVQSMSVRFDDGFEMTLMVDSVIGVEHPDEKEFVVLHIPVFTSIGSGHLTVSPRQMDSFMRNGLLREAHKWLMKKH